MEIVKLPQKILRKKARDVTGVDSTVITLIAKMKKTLKKCGGVGLAAPQIGSDLNIAVIGFTPSEEELKKNPNLESIPKITMINPKITWAAKDFGTRREGCLSAEKEVDVPRFKKIHIKYLDESGKKKKIKARGYLARVIQHEIDHLKGKLITDYQENKKFAQNKK